MRFEVYPVQTAPDYPPFWDGCFALIHRNRHVSFRWVKGLYRQIGFVISNTSGKGGHTFRLTFLVHFGELRIEFMRKVV